MRRRFMSRKVKHVVCVGDVHGMLTVIGMLNDPVYRKVVCRCECGAVKNVPSFSLVSGHTKSCGCLRTNILVQLNRTHGLHNTDVYKAWSNMIGRCRNKNNVYYRCYGGRGINVCDRWLNSFENFYKDVGDRPSSLHSLDRIDNDGDYTPENCRWATVKEQSRNRSTTKLTTDLVEEIRGLLRGNITQTELANAFGVDRKTIYDILYNKTWN